MQSANYFMMQENKLPILRTEEKKPFVADHSWGVLGGGEKFLFIVGIGLGTYVTLFDPFFEPCYRKQVSITANSFTFFILMIKNEYYWGNNFLLMMFVFSAVQVVQALTMDGCETIEETHGFNKQFDITPHLRELTINIERLISDAQQTIADIYGDYAINSWLDLYGQQQQGGQPVARPAGPGPPEQHQGEQIRPAQP